MYKKDFITRNKGGTLILNKAKFNEFFTSVIVSECNNEEELDFIKEHIEYALDNTVEDIRHELIELKDIQEGIFKHE